jgi:hypothetical protein
MKLLSKLRKKFPYYVTLYASRWERRRFGANFYYWIQIVHIKELTKEDRIEMCEDEKALQAEVNPELIKETLKASAYAKVRYMKDGYLMVRSTSKYTENLPMVFYLR